MFKKQLCARMPSRRGLAAGIASCLLVLCLMLSGCSSEKPRDAGGGVQVLIDGALWDGEAISPEKDGVRVYITVDGKPLLDAPFDEPRSIAVRQEGVGENTVEITGEAVYMSHADCENQDCVDMGEVTLKNVELRVLGGFIVCLPHRLSVEVRSE